MLRTLKKIYKTRDLEAFELFYVQDIAIQCSRKRVKNINLRIDAGGQVTLSAPMRCSRATLERFLQEKQAWIMRHHFKRVNQVSSTSLEFLTGESHTFLGKTYELMLHEHEQPQKIVLADNHLHCYFKTELGPEQKRLLFQQWHRAQMKALIPDLLHKWEPIVGVKVSTWGIKLMKTRWGSCHPNQKRIWLNLRLMHHPITCLEYVLVHELVHILEASHNQRFYALMTQFMPEWRTYASVLSSV